jgi:hypothetical protein
MTDFLGSTSLASISNYQPAFGPRILRDEGGTPSLPSAPASSNASIGAREAAQILQAERRKKQAAAPAATPAAPAARPAAFTPPVEAPAEIPADGAALATGDHGLSDEGNAAPVHAQVTGETDGTVNPAAHEAPPLPRPRSWTKEQDDIWNGLPRSTQEFLTEQATKASAEVRRIQNEAAENSKTLTAKEKAAEEQRNQYEGKLKSVVEIMEREQLRDFPGIRSQADLDKMVNDAVSLSAKAASLWATDPLQAGQVQAQVQQIQSTLAAWDVHQRKLVAATNELKASEERKTQEKATAWNKHVSEQNELAAKAIPELADKTKAPALIKAAGESLLALGFTQDELTRLSKGEERISIADHRFQVLVRSHLRLAEIQAAPRAVAPKNLPPVAKPGSGAPRSNPQSETLKALNNKLNNTGNIKDAVALLTAKRRAETRR